MIPSVMPCCLILIALLECKSLLSKDRTSVAGQGEVGNIITVNDLQQN